jgi:hypothetical protein
VGLRAVLDAVVKREIPSSREVLIVSVIESEYQNILFVL